MSRSRALSVSLLPALLAGCLSVGGRGDAVDERTYDLCAAAPAPAAVVEASHDAPGVQVERFQASSLLQREGLVWRRGEVEVGAYRRFRWARPPQDALREGVAAALRAEGGEGPVATEPPLPEPAWRLRGYLARCEELDEFEGDGQRWSGLLELHLALVRSEDGREVWRQTYRVVEPAPSRNPDGVAQALHRACEQVTAAAAVDLAPLLAGEAAPKGP